MKTRDEDDWSKMVPQVITLSDEDYDHFVEVMLAAERAPQIPRQDELLKDSK